jgi:hypothetical protein
VIDVLRGTELFKPASSICSLGLLSTAPSTEVNASESLSLDVGEGEFESSRRLESLPGDLFGISGMSCRGDDGIEGLPIIDERALLIGEKTGLK